MNGPVIHVRDMERFPDAVYVGRRNARHGLAASPFANPYHVGRSMPRAEAIRRYERRLRATPDLLARLPDLRGKPLACWCRRFGQAPCPATACHANVLVDLLDRHTDRELLALAGRGPAPVLADAPISLALAPRSAALVPLRTAAKALAAWADLLERSGEAVDAPRIGWGVSDAQVGADGRLTVVVHPVATEKE